MLLRISSDVCFLLHLFSFIYQADGDAEFKDGSFTEMLTSASEKQSFNGTGKTSNYDLKRI